MPTENTNTIPVKLYDVTRNDTTVPMYEVAKKKGKNAGEVYPAFIANTEEEKQQLLKFVGASDAWNWFISKLNQIASNLAKENTSAEGIFDVDGFLKNIQEMSARGYSSAELIERIVNLRDKYGDLADEIEAALDAGDINLAKELSAQRRAIDNEYKMLSAEYRAKKRTKSTADDEAAKAAGVAA